MNCIVFIAIIYGLIEMVKVFCKTKRKYFIPVYSIIVGETICIFGQIFNAGIFEFINFGEALNYGFLYGLSATGINQLLVNLKKLFEVRKEENLTKSTKTNKIVSFKKINFEPQNNNVTTQEEPEPVEAVVKEKR